MSLEESLNAKEEVISRLHEELLAAEQAAVAQEESHRAEVKRLHAVVVEKVRGVAAADEGAAEGGGVREGRQVWDSHWA